MSEERQATGGLDFVSDPVPVADTFQGDWSAVGEVTEEGPYGAGIVINMEAVEDLSVEVLDFDLGVSFVSVASDRDLVHGRPPVYRRNLRTRTGE